MRFKKGQRVVVDHCNEGFKIPRYQFYLGRTGVIRNVIVQSDPSYDVQFEPPHFVKDGSSFNRVSYFESELISAETKQPEEWM